MHFIQVLKWYTYVSKQWSAWVKKKKRDNKVTQKPLNVQIIINESMNDPNYSRSQTVTAPFA